MKWLKVSALLALWGCQSVWAANITGAGATFPYPLYAKWSSAYKAETGNVLNYQAIGSGGGIKQIQAGTVDFGATDKPLNSDQLRQFSAMQFPVVIGGIAPVVNLPGIKTGQIKLTGPILANIYLGVIKRWNDPAIVALNSEAKQFDLPITVVHRSDSSGTSFLFTDYLSKVSEEWKNQIGADAAISWPTGIGGKGNEGVAAYVQRINGAIGYVEYAYLRGEKLTAIQLANKDGQFVLPSLETFTAAAAAAEWQSKSDFSIVLTNSPGAKSWPIIGASFILMRTPTDKPEQTKLTLQFFDWAFNHGKEMAKELNYVALPEASVKLVQESWKAHFKDAVGKPLWQK